MAQFIRVSGKMTKGMVKVNLNHQRGIPIKVNGSMTKKKGKEFKRILTEQGLKEDLNRIFRLDKVFLLMPIENLQYKENGRKIRLLEKKFQIY
jgi:hypothetical protein